MKRKMKFNDKKGFTLIEILVVVAIIGILASVVLVGLGPAQKQGRDARRISDLKQVETALQLYFNKCGFYPGGINPDQPCTDRSAPADWTALKEALLGSGIGVNSIPCDPLDSTCVSNPYLYSSDGTSYVLGAQLEQPNTALDNDVDVDPFGGLDCTDPVYCVQL